MAKRTGLSNKIRFEVFKRDLFKCQYCGNSAPEVILNVDHINPVAKGGKNDLLNLITSCFDCNSGKSDRILSDNSVVAVQRKQLEELAQRREQLDMLIQWKSIITDKSYEIDSIVKFFNTTNASNISLTECGVSNLKKLLKKYTVENILDAITDTRDKYHYLDVTDRWDKIEKVLGFITASESDKNKMKLFGGIKARFTGTYGYSQWEIIKTNKTLREIFDYIDDYGTLTYTDLFKVLNSNSNYSDFQYDISELHNQIF